MKAMLVVAHGSRRAASDDEVRELTAKLAESAGAAFDHVRCAFLELAEPSIPDGLRAAISAGGRDAVFSPGGPARGRRYSGRSRGGARRAPAGVHLHRVLPGCRRRSV